MHYLRPQESAPVFCWREAGVAHIRFNRPRALNAIDVATAQQFLEACRHVAADTAVRAVVISGEGSAFMAGGDVSAMEADPLGTPPKLIEGMHGGIELLAQMDAPVVASVQGAVAGGGLGLALSCDLCIAAENTRFAFAYGLIGTTSDCGTSWALPRLIGLRKAMEIAMLCEPVDAQEALRLGLVNRVVPVEGLVDATARLAQQLGGGPTGALGRQKRLLREAFERELHEQLIVEAQSFAACAASSDFKEGMRAFLEKRPARFEGC